MRGLAHAATVIRWTAMLVQNMSAAVGATAQYIEAELQAQTLSPAVPVDTPQDVMRVARGMEPAGFDDHPAVDPHADQFDRE